jgi:DNA-binding transcriptional LysR family regulator
MALSLLPAGLGRLRADAPALAFRIRAADSAGVEALCLAGDIDAGLVTTPPADRRLSVLPLGRDPLCAVAAPGGASRLGLADLAAGPLCLYARGTGFRRFVDELFARAGLRPRAAAEMDSLEALRELVAAGLGRSLLPRSVVSAALRTGRLQALDVPDLPAAARTIALVRRADRAPHAAFEPLARALREAALDLLPE